MQYCINADAYVVPTMRHISTAREVDDGHQTNIFALEMFEEKMYTRYVSWSHTKQANEIDDVVDEKPIKRKGKGGRTNFLFLCKLFYSGING